MPASNSNPAARAAIILAAGFSTRMGQCKAALPWLGNQTLLSYQVAQFLQVGVQPIVVLGLHNVALQEGLDQRCAIALNPNAASGKVSSILTGLAHVPDSVECLFISAVDQPRPAWVYQRLLGAGQGAMEGRSPAPVVAPIVVPSVGQRLGHPLLFAGTMLPQLMQIQEETQGLRHLMQQFQHQVLRVPFEQPEILTDLNTPERYYAALKQPFFTDDCP